MRKRIVALIVVILFLCTVLAGCGALEVPSGSESAQPQQVGLVINELVASNQYSLVLEDGTSPDWVEIYNGTGQSINLKGYGLTDDTTDRYKFTFPSVALPAGGYLVVLATGTEDTAAADGLLRMGFKLSGTNGEELILSAPNDQTVQAISFDAVPTDISYGLDETGHYVYFGLPTPGEKNSGPTNTTPEFTEAVVESPLVINEFTRKNEYSIMDKDGERYEWVEIKNTGSEAINLNGYGLSDDVTDTKKWVFPDMELAPGELRIVFLSGKDQRDPNGELHANFGLGSTDTHLVLSQELGRSIDVVEIHAEMGNASYGRSAGDVNTWLYYPEPTPGTENTTKGFSEIDKATEKYLPDLYISETKVSAAARSGDADWIELANKGSETIDLTGYGLSDDKDEPFLFTFSEGSLAPGEYVVVKLDGGDSSLSAPFGLSHAGETVYLTRADGVVIDSLATGVQYPSYSSGRVADASRRDKVYFTTSTPGESNASQAYSTYAGKPVFSQAGGYVSAGTSISIQANDGATIYYTTDGSKPTSSSMQYTGPVSISKTTPLRAVAYEGGKLPSEVTTENYLIEEQHSIPVVCISVDPDEFFGYENGIYADGAGHTHDGEAGFPYSKANFWRDVEREISFEWFEADGTKGIEFPAGVKIFGQYSRALDQKSLVIKLRGAYGLSEVTYPFFRDYDVTTFNSLLLRVSGQDVAMTKLRDAMFAQAVKDTMDLDYQEYRPCAVYINGEYWGLYNLREQLDENYVANHYDVDPDTVDIIKGNSDVKAGSIADWSELKKYVSEHDLGDPEVYEYVKSRVDIEEYADYIITETFFCNTDSGNVRFWRDSGNNVYRWMLYDLDWGLFRTTYKWNYIEEYFNPLGHGIGKGFSTTLSCGLLENAAWKEYFIERYAWHLQNTFDPERICTLIDAMAAEIAPEMPRHIARWNDASDALARSTPSSMERWQSNVDELKKMATERVALVKEDLQEFFRLTDARMAELFPSE